MTEGSDFKIGNLVGFAKFYHNIIPRRKRGRGPGLEKFPKIWGFPFNIYAMAESIHFKIGTQFLWSIRPIKNHTNDKRRLRSRHGTFSTKTGIPFNMFAMAKIAMDVPNKHYYIENCKY